MNVDQTDKQINPLHLGPKQLIKKATMKRTSRLVRIARWVVKYSFRLFALIFALLSIGRVEYTPAESTKQAIHQTVQGWDFDLLSWTVDSSRAKAGLLLNDPADEMIGAESTNLVLAYIERTGKIGDLKRKQTEQIAEGKTIETESLQVELDRLYADQQKDRLLVESIIQQQVGSELAKEGITVMGKPFPPVLFSFTNPPKKMVVSPRDRIEVVYSEMIGAEIDMDSILQSESIVLNDQDLSMYITNIGGLGAFPTLVVETKNLEWILSTVAHEWAHNYLTLYPLGINYATSAELTIINETVAEIVGDEIGKRAYERYYPELVASTTAPPTSDDESEEDEEEETFDFRTEMRETRLAVDQYLAKGQIKEAEYYMELRRMDFVENGYPLRVLNQAYFAFHGSYGTSAASSSMIGPALFDLREQSPDLATFLEEVRWFTSSEDIPNFDYAN